MLLAKKLPSARDARIYMSVERNYLGYIRLSLYALSFSIFLEKLELIAQITQKMHVSLLLQITAIATALIGVFLILVGSMIFHRDILYIEGGIMVEPKEVIDPRIYMAAERTFLAWVRTAIALIVFGFVIERFEFFIVQLERVFNMHLSAEHHNLAKIGLFIIAIGITTLILGAINFFRTIKQVDRGFYRTSLWYYKLYGLIIFLTCLVLTFYVLRIV
ncbi:MAG: YidH family protein [Aquificaceae bacterium]